MKKIPCLFQREFRPREGGRGVEAVLLETVTPGLEWVLAGEGIATRKWDGTACMVRDGALWRRYDAKRDKPAPSGGIPCDEPDEKTGHWPHWVPSWGRHRGTRLLARRGAARQDPPRGLRDAVGSKAMNEGHGQRRGMGARRAVGEHADGREREEERMKIEIWKRDQCGYRLGEEEL
jgi:hypothetical protein